jgi:hypothetical protein
MGTVTALRPDPAETLATCTRQVAELAAMADDWRQASARYARVLNVALVDLQTALVQARNALDAEVTR